MRERDLFGAAGGLERRVELGPTRFERPDAERTEARSGWNRQTLFHGRDEGVCRAAKRGRDGVRGRREGRDSDGGGFRRAVGRSSGGRCMVDPALERLHDVLDQNHAAGSGSIDRGEIEVRALGKALSAMRRDAVKLSDGSTVLRGRRACGDLAGRFAIGRGRHRFGRYGSGARSASRRRLRALRRGRIDLSEQAADQDAVALLRRHARDASGSRCRHFDVDLVRGDVDERRARFDPPPGLHVPFDNRPFGDRLAHLGQRHSYDRFRQTGSPYDG